MTSARVLMPVGVSVHKSSRNVTYYLAIPRYIVVETNAAVSFFEHRKENSK